MYQKMYLTLFNAVTDALSLLEQGDAPMAEERLKRAQRETEKLYISEQTETAAC